MKIRVDWLTHAFQGTPFKTRGPCFRGMTVTGGRSGRRANGQCDLCSDRGSQVLDSSSIHAKARGGCVRA